VAQNGIKWRAFVMNMMDFVCCIIYLLIHYIIKGVGIAQSV
jgi:hypothetical protein